LEAMSKQSWSGPGEIAVVDLLDERFFFIELERIVARAVAN